MKGSRTRFGGVLHGHRHFGFQAAVFDDQSRGAVLQGSERGACEFGDRRIQDSGFDLPGDVLCGGVVEAGDDENLVEIRRRFESDGFRIGLDRTDGGIGRCVPVRQGGFRPGCHGDAFRPWGAFC